MNTVDWELSNLVSLSTVIRRSRNKNRNTVWAVVGNMVELMGQFTGFRNKFLCGRFGAIASGAVEGVGGHITPF